MGTTFKLDEGYDPHAYTIPNISAGNALEGKGAAIEAIYPEIGDYKRMTDVERYRSADWMRREWSALWEKVWHVAGRVSDLPESGSWLKYDVGPESIIVNRTRSGEIKAFYNVCQHRGRQLVEDDYGRTPRFVCPFHSWTFDNDGTCVNVTDRRLFDEKALCGDLNLRAVRCETWGGFVFVNFDPDAAPLGEFLGPVMEAMKVYKLEEMHVVHEVTVPIRCNWKLGLEAFLEAYHVHMTHPQVTSLVDDVYEQSDIYPGGHSRLATRLGVASPRLGVATQLNDLQKFLLMESGVDLATFTGGPADIQSAMVEAKRRPDNRYGLDYSGFSDSLMLDDWNYFIFPNMTLNTHPEGVSIMRFIPDADDPALFHYHVHIIIPKLKGGCKAPFYMGVPEENDVSGKTRPQKIYGTMDNPQVGEVFEQDISNMEAAQRGVRSRGLDAGMRYAEREMRLQVLHAEIDRYFARAEAR